MSGRKGPTPDPADPVSGENYEERSDRPPQHEVVEEEPESGPTHLPETASKRTEETPVKPKKLEER